MMQGTLQEKLGSDKKIGAATGSNAATKEALPDASKRSKSGSKPKR
jgi:hypothetical protein